MQCGGLFFGDYTGLTAVDNAHRLGLGMDTRDHRLFHCPGTATPTAPRGVCTGTAPNGSTANDQDIVTAAHSGTVRASGARTRGSGTEGSVPLPGSDTSGRRTQHLVGKCQERIHVIRRGRQE
jgi:hypothetical protein